MEYSTTCRVSVERTFTILAGSFVAYVGQLEIATALCPNAGFRCQSLGSAWVSATVVLCSRTVYRRMSHGFD